MMDSREAIAKHFFMIMNKGRFGGSGGIDCVTGLVYRPATEQVVLNGVWEWYKEQRFADGYYRLADETVSKGYKP